jgi:glycerophosphoryl diester phosphodiesterase
VAVLRIAHRGYAAIARENSLEAIAGAVVLGADAVEIDVRRRADGALVLDHDTGQAANAPLLADALALLAASTLAVNLDLKEPATRSDVVAAVRASGMLGRTTVTGTCWSVLSQIARSERGIRAGLTLPRRGSSLPRALRPVAGRLLVDRIADAAPRLLARHGATLATVHHRLVSASLVERVHAAGGSVWCWTVDEPREVERLLALGVDGICSDHPASHGLGEGYPSSISWL